MKRAVSALVLLKVLLAPTLLAISVLTFGQQSSEAKPTVSDQPLTTEQLAIYKLILRNWMDDAKHTVHLGIQTVPLESDGPVGSDSCAKGLDLEPVTPLIVHRFRVQDIPQLGSDKIALVDPDKQSKEVSSNDPEKSIRNGASVDNAVNSAFAHGLVTLSEIRFDVKHEHAIVWYGFRCGGLCGNGGTAILEKKNGVWHRGRDCSVWMSRFAPPADACPAKISPV